MRKGKRSDIHSEAWFLETNLNGIHHTYYEGLVQQSPASGDTVAAVSAETLLAIAPQFHSAPLTTEQLTERIKDLADEHIEWATGDPSPNAGKGINKLPAAELPYKEVTLAATTSATDSRFAGTAAQMKTCEDLLKSYGHSAELTRQLTTVRYSMYCGDRDLAHAIVDEARGCTDGVSPSISEDLQRLDGLLTSMSTQVENLMALYLSLHLTFPRLLLEQIVPTAKPRDLMKPASTLLDPATAAVHKRHAELMEGFQSTSPTKQKKVKATKNQWTVSTSSSGTAGRGGTHTATSPTSVSKSARKRAKQKAQKRKSGGTPTKGPRTPAAPQAAAAAAKPAASPLATGSQQPDKAKVEPRQAPKAGKGRPPGKGSKNSKRDSR